MIIFFIIISYYPKGFILNSITLRNRKVLSSFLNQVVHFCEYYVDILFLSDWFIKKN